MGQEPPPRRLLLDGILSSILGSGDQLWFQPPSDVKMDYTNGAIIYNEDNADINHADNLPYRRTKRYQVTVITRDPDSPIPDKVAALPMCTISRVFQTQNLNHYVFDLYF